MGGHAFKGLHCPRISPTVYKQVKAETTAALQTIFAHVVVPTEMPCKDDYGDVDFLVCSPLHSPESTTIDDFDWQGTVRLIKDAFQTIHGRRGFLNADCMYFAIDSPYGEEDYFIQVDVKVCFKPELFHWYTFELNYASNSKMIGSMVKPLGLTIDPQGLHIRVEEIEETNFPGSMVWIGKDPKDVLRVVELDRRITNAGFKTKDEIYEYFASSWLFNPAHFAARLAEEKYYDRLEDRSPHWTYFIKEWVPKHYPGYRFVQDAKISGEDPQDIVAQFDEDLQTWYKHTRAAVRDKVFTMFPHVATEYYVKRAAWAKQREEHRLREMITQAIPSGGNGWKDDFPKPHIIVKQPAPIPLQSTVNVPDELTPPPTPPSSDDGTASELPPFPSPSTDPWSTPLYLDPLPRNPPLPCTPHPPPSNMAPSAKLLCLARWTLFDPPTGTPYLSTSPRDKDFDMHWADAVHAGATDKVLVNWAKDMWWCVWMRQAHVNYVGMWKRRFEKEDRKAEMGRVEVESEVLVRERREKILGRLRALNEGFALVDGA